MLPDDEHIHAGDVNGETPPVHEPSHISAGEQDTHHHQHGASPAAQGHQGGHKDAGQSYANVPDQLYTNNSISLPVDVGQCHGK